MSNHLEAALQPLQQAKLPTLDHAFLAQSTLQISNRYMNSLRASLALMCHKTHYLSGFKPKKPDPIFDNQAF